MKAELSRISAKLDGFELMLEILSSYLLRSFLVNTISAKRISQLCFQSMVEILAKESSPNSIIYIKSDELEEFISTRVKMPKVLVSGGSDHDLTEREYQMLSNFPDTIFYIQNLNFDETTHVRLLPIGVEDYRWGRNGMPWNFSQKKKYSLKAKRVLVGPFRITDESRRICQKSASRNPYCVILKERLANWKYSKIASQFGFVACPRGNGLDTHRFWETIYRGSKPIILNGPNARNLAKYGVPFCALGGWEALENFVPGDDCKMNGSEPEFTNPHWWMSRFRRDLCDSDGK